MNTIHKLFDKSGLLWQLETGKIIYVLTVKKINNNNKRNKGSAKRIWKRSNRSSLNKISKNINLNLNIHMYI